MNPSPAQIEANRANAQLSTGPTSQEGKAKSSLNAVKTGLTGRSVLQSTDDALAYQRHLDRHFTHYAPATDQEKSLVQSIADTEWRLLRITPLEAGIYAVGRRKLADRFADETDSANREALIMAEVFVVFLKQLSNLNLQERRLRNQRAEDVAQLEHLQKDRQDKHAANLKRAEAIYKSSQQRGLPFDPAFFGFVFSVHDIDTHIQHEKAAAFASGAATDLDQEQFAAYFAQWKARQAA